LRIKTAIKRTICSHIRRNKHISYQTYQQTHIVRHDRRLYAQYISGHGIFML